MSIFFGYIKLTILSSYLNHFLKVLFRSLTLIVLINFFSNSVSLSSPTTNSFSRKFREISLTWLLFSRVFFDLRDCSVKETCFFLKSSNSFSIKPFCFIRSNSVNIVFKPSLIPSSFKRPAIKNVSVFDVMEYLPRRARS